MELENNNNTFVTSKSLIVIANISKFFRISNLKTKLSQDNKNIVVSLIKSKSKFIANRSQSQ